jgi:hypothetical protein
MNKANSPTEKKSQLERFKEAAKQVETDDSEQNFDRALKKISGARRHAKETGSK